MKKSLLINPSFCIVAILLLFLNVSHSQQFSTTKPGIIYDSNNLGITPTLYQIEVSGLPNATNSQFGLEKVCFHIKHKNPTDLKIELTSPDGTSVWLSNRNGGKNNYGYLNTCVVQNGFDGSLTSPNHYFQGEYTAEGRLEFFNQNLNPNGTWQLIITDLKPGTIGKLEIATITFSSNPAKFNTSSCTLNSPSNCTCSDSKNRLLPNLIVSEKLTIDNIHYFGPDDKKHPNQLRFAAAMANIGEGPLHVITSDNWYCDGYIVDKSEICQDGSSPINSVQQVLYRIDNNQMHFDTVKAGSMYFDNTPGHNHYHVSDWADFKVLKKCWWTNNPKRWKVIASSNKVSYCLFDNKTCTEENEFCSYNDNIYSQKNLNNYGLGQFSACNSTEQGISVGGIDYYGMYYEGQKIDLPPSLTKGKYYLYIEVDPENEYLELNENDNTILVPFEIK